ncbi:MAG TPA: helix-turn-helix transcriptional regulator [Thermoanaerobaculia bacterium]|nr:helix-turn-helix transcriptional regulator [Thermoanaerobaculia bacterium]
MSPNHNPKYKILLHRLRAARKTAGLTQAEAARRVGQRQAFISKVEANKRTIDPVELVELAQVYGRSIEYFLDFREPGEGGSEE